MQFRLVFLGNDVFRLLSGKEWEIGIFASSLCTEPWGIATRAAQVPIKNYFFICYSLVGLVDAGSIGFQSKGPIPQMAALKVISTICVAQTLHSSGRSWDLAVPS